jgi:hypothetical protein
LRVLDYPLAVFVVSFLLLWLAAVAGGKMHQRRKTDMGEDMRSDLNLVTTAALTLLALIIGFSFSMATERYDQRKNYEEAEANAIGTEYVRADLLPVADRNEAKRLLREYTELRIQYYTTRSRDEIAPINQKTEQMQNALWAVVAKTATPDPTPLMALASGGMNDVLNSQGYTQAAWWNRIPQGAWYMMLWIAMFCNFLMGYGSRVFSARVFMVLPLLVAVSFFLISDIDSPRSGVIRVTPQNLISLQQGFGAQ